MCPVGYSNMVDTQSWGICSCWANGGKRPDNATNQLGCHNIIPEISETLPVNSDGKLCPYMAITIVNDKAECACPPPGDSSQCVDGIYYNTDLIP